MPRKWSNGGGQGGCLTHVFTPRTPVQTVDYRVFDDILARNAKIASREKPGKKDWRKR